MTANDKLEKANRWRVKEGHPEHVSSDEDGWNGHFFVPMEGQIWNVRISDGMGWRHLSVTNLQRPQKMPDWGIMCRLKELFFADEALVVEFHPPKYDNINDHPYCLHLWESIDQEFPVPMSMMV